MSPASDPRYFGKSPFSHLKNASEVAAKIMRGETVEEEKPEVTPEEPTTTQQEKSDG